MSKNLKKIKSEIKTKQELLDDAIFYFNKDNNKLDEHLIKRYKKELAVLYGKKQEIEEG